MTPAVLADTNMGGGSVKNGMYRMCQPRFSGEWGRRTALAGDTMGQSRCSFQPVLPLAILTQSG
jgi:hypothetical protein